MGKSQSVHTSTQIWKNPEYEYVKVLFEIGTNPQLFDGLAISKETKLCEAYMGKFPVLFISLKGVEGLTYQDAERGLANIIIKEAKRFRF